MKPLSVFGAIIANVFKNLSSVNQFKSHMEGIVRLKKMKVVHKIYFTHVRVIKTRTLGGLSIYTCMYTHT